MAAEPARLSARLGHPRNDPTPGPGHHLHYVLAQLFPAAVGGVLDSSRGSARDCRSVVMVSLAT